MASKWKAGTLVAALVLSTMSSVYAGPQSGRSLNGNGEGSKFRHVLLISIDGMHALDFENCAKGISTINGGLPYCPNLAQLGKHGVNYLGASTSKPSDSFPGLMTIVTGGSPRTMGIFYDVAYDRSLDPPINTTGNGVTGTGLAGCTPDAAPTGTRTEYEEGISIDETQLNGGAPGGADGGPLSLDPTRMPRDPSKGCAPVYPWNFVRVNTVFGVIHAAGGYTAWSDKHPAYMSVSGPGDGTNVDDYYAPEVNSPVVALPVTTPSGVSCTPIPDQTDTSDYTRGFQNITCYDTLKVNAILNEIDGKTHDGKANAPVPAIFGMNFQAVSVGQKLIEKSGPTGGYQDAIGTPTTSLLSDIVFVDKSIGEMVSHLKKNDAFDSTLIIITAKHGQSPIDPNRFFPIPGPSGANGQSPSSVVASLLPDSEVNQIGPTEDDLSLLWLADSSQTSNAVAMLEAKASTSGIGEIYSGPALNLLFNPPGMPPNGDPRSPDIFVESNIGVIYTGSARKLMEHGGFAHDDTNVMMLLSNPSFESKTVTGPVQTAQVAPTILKALGLDPNSLQAVRKDLTPVLPGLVFGE
jgi:Type I phosphodiesterase / nucleotide pyrophosphatase